MLEIPKHFDKSKSRKRLADSRILVPHLEHALAEFEEPWQFTYSPKQGDTAWHPSSDCLPPPTILYAKAKGLLGPEIRSASSTKNFQVGHFWHALLQHLVLHKLELCEPEAIEREGAAIWGTVLDIPDEYGNEASGTPYHWVHGAGDIVPLITPKWEGVVDIKTMKQEDFAFTERGLLPPNFVHKYRCQINIYMHLFDQEQGMFLAVNKNGPHDMKEITYVRDDALIDSIMTKWRFVSDCLDRDIEPTEDDDNEYDLGLGDA